MKHGTQDLKQKYAASEHRTPIKRKPRKAFFHFTTPFLSPATAETEIQTTRSALQFNEQRYHIPANYAQQKPIFLYKNNINRHECENFPTPISPFPTQMRHLPTRISRFATPFSRIRHAFKRFQTIAAAFQCTEKAFPDVEKSISNARKHRIIVRKKAFRVQKHRFPSSKTSKKIIHLRNNRTQNHVIRETKSKCSDSGTQ